MSDDTFETIEWSLDEETGVGSLVLDRPESLNALSAQLRDDVVAGFDRFRARDEEMRVRAVVVSGRGDRAFCAGADVNDFQESDPESFSLSAAHEAVASFPAPVVAMIDGYCLGGGLELALACDFRFASERSEIGHPEVDLGLIPGGGGTQRLARLVGPSRAKELCMTGERIDAETAATEGILTRVCAADELDAAVDDFVETLAGKSVPAVRAVKDVVDTGTETSLDVGQRYERRAFQTLRETDAHERAVEEFLDG
ncbi:MAG: enoyl-CoA hydratase/isomerase family protein [Haloferacaceae archaeon]